MAELTIFHYVHNNSILHKLDGRVKLFSMLLFSISASISSTFSDLTLLTLILLIVLYISKLPFVTLLKELKYFSFLLFVIFIAHSFTIPGTPIPYFPIPGATIEGAISGLYFSWRIILIIIISIILIGTTTISLLRDSIEWFLRPIPFIPAARIALMINLTFVLIPLIFDQTKEILNAQKARGIARRRNPYKRIKFTAFPLLIQSFRRTDEMILAMEARSYSEDRTKAVFTVCRNDWLVLSFTIVIIYLIIFY